MAKAMPLPAMVACVCALVVPSIVLPTTAEAGECVHCMDAGAIVCALSGTHPDSLATETKYLLGCLDCGVRGLQYRVYSHPPSWRLLRNIRREYHLLGANAELVASVAALRSSRDPLVRSWAAVALALYGQPVAADTLAAAVPDLASRAMILAFLGDSGGVHVAVDGYGTAHSDRERTICLHALYYQGTEEANKFLARVAQDPADANAERARWMVDHPFDREASWKL